LRPSVTSAEDGRGYSRRALYLVGRNILPLCVLGLNSIVRTSLKSSFLAKSEGSSRTAHGHLPRAYTHLDAGPRQKFTGIFCLLCWQKIRCRRRELYSRTNRTHFRVC
jgi:hypothetical protein